MKLCLTCNVTFDQIIWTCPSCYWTPAIINGFFSFSPELANNNDGLHENAHHLLNKYQSGSFWFRKRNQLIQDMIRRYFPHSTDVLEIGCGSGFVLGGIRDVLPTARLTATEIYANGLHYAASRVSQPSQFLQVDARKLPFKDEFDLIGAFDVLEHIEEDELVIKNMRQSLKPGGSLILTVPQHPWLWSKVDEIACHKRRYKRKQLSLLLRQNGFEILQDTSFMFFLLPLMLIQRLVGSRKSDYNPVEELALPKMLDKMFEILLECERRIISYGINFPIGGSRLVVARLSKYN
jgi:SAM-dependent methyltransferase